MTPEDSNTHLRALEARCEAHSDQETTVAAYDEERDIWEIGHEPIGPAGFVATFVNAAVLLKVDIASQAPLRLEVLGELGESAQIVAALYGRAAVRALETSEELEIDSLPARPADEELARAFCRLALLDHFREEAQDAGRPVGWWNAEAALLCSQIAQAGIPGFAERAALEAEAGARTVLEGVPRALLARPAQVAAVISALERERPSEADALAQIASALPSSARSRSDEGSQGRRESARARRLLLLARLVPASAASLSETRPFDEPAPAYTYLFAEDVCALAGIERKGELFAPDEKGLLRWRWQRAGAGELPRIWIRALVEDDDRSVLAKAPLRSGESGESVVSEIQIPPRFDWLRLRFDLTSDLMRPPDGSRLALIDEAIREGRLAALSERLEDDKGAITHWNNCARAWEDVGEPLRQAMALRYCADAQDRDEPGSGDMLREVARGALLPESQWRLLAARTVPPAAFLAELLIT